MDLDSFKVFAPVVLGIIGTAASIPVIIKAWAEYRNIRSATLRAESIFSWEIAERFKDEDLKRYSENISYSAIVGGVNLSHAQRKSLLLFSQNAKAVDLYLKSEGLVILSVVRPIFTWKIARYRRNWYRKLIKFWLFLAYFFMIIAGFFPIISRYFTHPNATIPAEIWIFEIVIVPIFLAGAISQLVYKFRIDFAEELMALETSENDPDLSD